MASKKAGRLAGLAALAGLAYMNKDKLFGAKGETKAAETKAETKVKDTAAEDAKAAAKRDADEETMGYTPSGNAAMYEKEPGFETKTTPAKVARSEKAPSASVAKAPAASTAMPEGAFRGRRSDIVGGGRSGGRGGPEAGEEAAYRAKDAKQAELMSSYKPRRPDTKLRDVTFDRKTQFSNKALSQMGAETRGPTIGNAKPVAAEGGDRSTRADNAKPVFAPGGNRSVRNFDYENDETKEMKRGGKVKKMASGGMTSSASKRADGIATKGKTRGRMC
jgi:hypothetical protein